jgi:hypothetical protein
VGKSVEKVETITMSQKDGDIAKVDGVTVGGAKFGEDGKWSGDWSALKEKAKGNELRILVAPSTALVLQVTLK